MGTWVWGEAVLAIVVIVAGGIAWLLARGCAVTLTGAAGAMIGGVVSLVTLTVMIDTDAALRISAALTIASGVWLLAFALAGGIRGQRALRAETRRDEAARDPATKTAGW